MFASQEKLAREYDALATAYQRGMTVCEQSALPKPDYFDSRIYDEFATYSFEREEFVGPKDYDGYLTSMYGDYMQLPPEDQRGNRHQIVEIDFGEE